MCGIIGIASNKSVTANIIQSLKKLEYRGYDSSGIATIVDGYIDEIRISKGVARWTANFTPPTAPYTTGVAAEFTRRLLSGSVDISGQPAGTNMKYKITTHNQAATKQTRVYGTSMAWA